MANNKLNYQLVSVKSLHIIRSMRDGWFYVFNPIYRLW